MKLSIHLVIDSLGQVGISLNSNWLIPKSTDPDDVEATERALQFNLGWFAEPIFGNGTYPDAMRSRIDERSTLQGFNQSRLPSFSDSEKNLIKRK